MKNVKRNINETIRTIILKKNRTELIIPKFAHTQLFLHFEPQLRYIQVKILTCTCTDKLCLNSGKIPRINIHNLLN